MPKAPAKAKVESRNRVFHYKVAKLVPGQSTWSLQKSLEQAFKAVPKPAARMQLLGTDPNSDQVVVFWRQSFGEMLCGIAQRFRKDAKALATLFSDDAENFEIVQLEPPAQADAKIKAQYAQTLLHFGIHGNHVVLTEPRGLDSETLENHFHWLAALAANATGAPPEKAPGQILLEDYIPPAYRDRTISNVRGITLQPSAATPTPTGHGDKGSPEALASGTIIEDDPLIEHLLEFFRKRLLKSDKKGVEDIEEAFKKGNLNASVSLNLRRGKTDHSLDEFARAMRHTTGVNYEMALPHGESLKSTQSKIARSYSVKMNHELPLPESIFGRMKEMLETLAGAGEIDSDP